MNILIVEPSKIYQQALERLFAPYATHIFTSDSGDEALKIYCTTSIDLVCSSFYLVDMDGTTFVSNIRKLKWGKTVPVLLITSKDSPEATIQSMRDGVTEVFQKNNLMAVEKYLMTYAQHAKLHADLSGNILFITPDLQEAEMIRSFFKNTQLQIVHFTNAEEAANMARAAEFDLVITNLVLDETMSGMALIREIRHINETMNRVPILAITSDANISQKIELLRAGANDIVHKPILLEELSIRVKNLLQTKKLFDTVESQRLQLQDMAFNDQLTSLYNRHYLSEIGGRVFDDANRHNYPVTMLIIDLDYFKNINDTYGHATGDIVLQSIAELLKQSFRGSDIPIRYGGEEFLVLLPHCNSEQGLKKAETLRQQIEVLNPASIPVTASIGVSSSLQQQDISYKDLFSSADQAMYKAKNCGRNTVVFCKPKGTTSDNLSERLESIQ